MLHDLRPPAEEPHDPAWAVVEALGIGRWEADPSMVRVHRVSPGVERLLGFPAKRWTEEMGLWLSRLHPLDRARTLGQRSSHQDHVAEYRFLTADGRMVHLRESVSFQRDASGAVRRVVGILQDASAERRSAARLAAQTGLAGVLAAARSLDEVAIDVLRVVAAALGYEVGALWRRDPGEDVLRCDAVWVADHVAAASFESATRATTLAPGVDLPGRVLQTGRPAWVSDVLRDSNFPRAAQAAREGLHAGVAVPIRTSGRPYGVLELFTREVRPPDEPLVAILESIGTQLGQFEDRREAEAQARDLGLRRSAIFEAALDAIVTTDARGRVLEWNRAAEATFGWTREEATGRPLRELILPPEERQMPITGQRVEAPAMRKDGTRFAAEVSVVRLELEAEGHDLETWHVRDVSERRAVEVALRESEARYRFLADAVPQQVWTAQPGGTLDYANRRAVEYFGVDPASAGWDVLVHPEDLPRLHEAWATARASGEPFEIEARLRRRDGEHRWHIVRAEALKGGARGVVRWFGSSIDIEEKKRQEARMAALLREVDDQRKRLDNIIATVPGVVWEAWGEPDAKRQRIDFVSDHVVELLGYTRDEWLATPNFWLSIVHPDDAEETAQRARRAFDMGQGGSKQFRWRRKDGTYVWVQAWDVVVKDDLGRPIGMRGVTLDISKVKEAEELLRTSDERFRLLARATSDTVYDWDLATDSFWWNENFTTMFGYAPAEVEPTIESWASRLHPDDLARVKTGMLTAIQTGDPTWQDEYRFRRRDGTYAAILDRGFIIRDATGRAVRIVGSMMDITERRRAEQAAARLAAIVQNSEDAIYGKSLDGLITDWNPGAQRLYGYAREEIVGKPIQTVVPPDRVEEEQRILAAIARGESVPTFETERVRKDGSRISVSLTVSPIRDARGALVGASAVARDMSARVAAERETRQRAQELAHLTEMLSKSNKELDQFAYITSHDLKAPLRGIANLSRWIEEDVGEGLSPEARKHLDLLRGRVSRMEALIDAILEYSRVGRVKAKPERVDVGDMLADTIDLLAPPQGFRVEVDGAMPTIVTERMRLQQVFLNLIGNAIKHHHDKAHGRVVVSAEDAGAMWRFKVADDGPGIAPRFHEKIFVIFQTLEARDKVEGTGIGLAVVKKIVEAFGGTIAVDSDVGRGATFHFTWPK